MKKIFILIFTALTVFISSKDNLEIFLDMKLIDGKNYVWDSVVKSEFNAVKKDGYYDINSLVLYSEIPAGDMIFKIETLLVNKEDKGKYVSFNEEKETDFPIKIIESDEYSKLLEKITSTDEKKFIESLYQKFKYNNYNILVFPKGTDKKEIREQVRNIFSKYGYKNSKMIVWKITYNGKIITGVIDDKKNKIDLKFGNVSATGDYNIDNSDYMIDGKKYLRKMYSITFDKSKISGGLKMYLPDVTKMKFHYTVPQNFTDDEIALMIFDLLFMPIVSRY